jgi:molybdate transport system permease protein
MGGWLTDEEATAFLLSLQVAAAAVAFSLPIAVVVALVLARGRFPGKVLLDGIVHLPLVLPPVVVGYLLLVTLGRRAPIGAWLYDTFGVQLIFTTAGASVAAAIVAFPFQVRAIRLGIEAVDRGLEQAAHSLGAGRVDAFFSVTLPLMLPGLIAGAVTAFAAALGEFGAIITFVSNVEGETRTLPLAIYTAIQTPGGEAQAARLVVLSVVLALSALVLAEWSARSLRRRLAQG